MPTQTINSVTIHYAESGRGPNLVLLHAFPIDSRIWENQIEHLSDRFRVIAPDFRGFGKTTTLEAFTLATLADDVHALLESIDALPCILGGLSMGGYVALACVKKCPPDLRGLILIDTRAEADTTEGKANRDKMIELVRTSGPRAVAEQMVPKMLSDQTRQSRPEIMEKLRQMIMSQPPHAIENALRALRDREDYTDELASIAIPTLILVGEHDVLTPPDMSRSMHQRIPRSQLTIIPACGHLTPLENPEAVNREMDRFLSTLR